MASANGWYGFDLDGTMAKYNSGDFRKYGWNHIGEPIEAIIDIMKNLIAAGHTVKVCTARVSEKDDPNLKDTVKAIQDYTELHVGKRLEVTNEKDFEMIALFDDRAVQVMPNEGVLVENVVRALIQENVQLNKEVERLQALVATMLENSQHASIERDLTT